jgi:hypothetical protein
MRLFNQRVLILTKEQEDVLYVAIRRQLDLSGSNNAFKRDVELLHEVKYKIDGRK